MESNLSAGFIISLIEQQFWAICSVFTESIVIFFIRRFIRGNIFRDKAVIRCGGHGRCDKCDKLEACPIESNRQLWTFDIKSKDVNWEDIVKPLAERGPAIQFGGSFPYLSSTQKVLDEKSRRKVLVCHDMMGNYLEDRFYHSSVKFDDYRFFHWSGVDYFCYFSHKYITIPPCGWISAAHSHGVTVLGTFITESPPLLEEVLRSKDTIDITIDALVRLCQHFCFEGWLLNIECKVDAKFIDKLFYFIEKLRYKIQSHVKNGIVFWYDSVINTGDLRWQNEINERNIRFFKLTDATLINYSWNDKSMENTTNILQAHHQPDSKTYFGIDIFGRGQVAKFQTRQTLARISRTKFSIGIFAPAWTFETLEEYGYNVRIQGGDSQLNDAFLLRNDKFWWTLWEYLPTHSYIKLPLYSDFCVGSGKYVFNNGDKARDRGAFFNLSQQSLQPSVPLYRCVQRHFEDAFSGGSSLRLILENSAFRIFCTDYHIDGTLVFAYAFKLSPKDGDLDIILRLTSEECAGECLLFLGDYYITKLTPGRCYLSPISLSYIDELEEVFDAHAIDMKIPPGGSENWKVRYYVLNFDIAVKVKDIGAMYRKGESASDAAYLGAVYLNNVEHITLPLASKAAYLKMRGDGLFK